MFIEDTVIILGAGSSWHYNYPTGSGLIQEITDTLQHAKVLPLGLKNIANKTPYMLKPREMVALQHIPEYQNFLNSLHKHEPISIDNFLRDHESLADIGRQLILYTIKKHELNPKTSTYTKNGKESWYPYLIEALLPDPLKPERILENKLSVITFNYDVSLEQYLYDRLPDRDTFKSASPQNYAIQYLSEHLKIVHVYGSVCDFAKSEERSIYGNFHQMNSTQGDISQQLNWCWDNKERIHVIGGRKHAELYNAPWILEARKLIEKAKYVYILGFSFDPDNTRLLQLSRLFNFRNGAIMRCTNYNNNYNVMSELKKCFPACFADGKFLYGMDSHPVSISHKNVYEAAQDWRFR
jgi:hypothetical protein